jgi:lipopolysaccharide export system permease protein
MLKTLDRYLITELIGPSIFGLSAFALIFAATYILSISRLVADEHAPLWAALEYFLYQIPQIIVLVIPMALLLGTLLALQRLSGESELTAMKAGGISLSRIVTPILATGLAVSLFSLTLQEQLVPFAQERAQVLLNDVIRHVGIIARGLDVTMPLPGGGRQFTAATNYEASTGTLQNVTVIQYDPQNVPEQIIFSRQARFMVNTWSFDQARTYHFSPDGSMVLSVDPQLVLDIGEQPKDILEQRAANSNPDELSRSQLHEILGSKGLTDEQRRKYRGAFDAKLAQPFACFVFTIIAIPFGLRRARGGGTSMGFGLAVAIVFIYYIILTTCRGFASMFPAESVLFAWTPNLIFTAIGALLVRRAAES